MDQKLLAVLNELGTPISLQDQERLVRMLIYGDFGHGKTTLAGDIAKVILEKYGGIHCIITTDSNWVVLNNDEFVRDRTLRQPFDGFNQLKAIAQAKLEGIEPYDKIKVITWDTVSTSCDIVLRNLVDKKVFKNKDGTYPIIPGWDHYRYLAMLMRNCLEELNKTDINLIFNTHLREPDESDKAKGKLEIRSNIPAKTFESIGQEVQAIGWLYREKEGNERLIQFEPTRKETGKSQIPTIPEGTYKTKEIPPLIEKWLTI